MLTHSSHLENQHPCHLLDGLRMLWFAHRRASKGPCVEDLVPNLWCCQKMKESIRYEAQEKEDRLLEVLGHPSVLGCWRYIRSSEVCS